MPDSKIFHILIVDQSQKNITALRRFKILSQAPLGSWVIYKVAVKESNLKDAIKFIQSNMNEGNWYFHAYNEDGSKLIVVFKNRIFHTDNNPKHWSAIINYGMNQGMPKEQLDFVPNTFADETY